MGYTTGWQAYTPWGGINNLFTAINDPNVDLMPGIGPNETANNNGVASPQQVQAAIDANKARQQVQGVQSTTPNNLNIGQGTPYTGGAAAVGDPATASFYADQQSQLQSQVGQLDRQQDIGLGNILNSYNTSANRIDEQNAVAKRNYDTQVQQNDRGYLNNRNNIMSQTRAQANSLQRLLGLAGAGNSSAAYEQAPYAAALQGSQNLSGAQGTYGNNAAALDTNWQDTQRSYKNSKEDLDNQRYQQENGLRSSIAQTRASLLDKIASAGSNAALARGGGAAQAQAARTPFQQQINDLLGQITNYGQQYANPVMRAADVSYAAPDLNQYTAGKFDAATTSGGGAASDVSPTFLGMLTGGQQRDKYGNLIG